MGRHSIPDPEESSGGPPEGASDATESFDEPLYTGYQPGPPEPEYPSHGEAELDTGYDDEYDEFDDEFDDKYESEHPGVPEYLQPGYREPEIPEDEFRRPAAETASFAAPPPPPKIPPRAQHSGDWEGGEWTGSHRAITAGRRGVSLGVIGALVAVVVVVAAFILWRFFGDALSDRSSVASARCVDGQKGVAVIADPSIAEPISTLGKKFNESANPVGDSCVEINVKPGRIRPGDQRVHR